MAVFPEEVLENIFLNLRPTFLQPHWQASSVEERLRYSTLAAVCRTSKACSRIATDILYHKIDLCCFNDCPGDDEEAPAGPINSIPLLLRTFLDRQDLALQIKELKAEEFENSKGASLHRYQLQEHSAVLHRETYKTILQDTPISTNLLVALLWGLENDSKDACLATLFLLCQNLQYVEYAKTLLELGQQKTLQRPLPQLQAIAFRGVGHHIVRLSCLQPFLTCDALRKVKVYHYYAVTEFAPRNLRCRGVTRLELEQGGFNRGGLTQLLRCFANLREFSMEMLGTSIHFSDGSRACVSPGVVGECLRAAGTQIEKLVVVVGNTPAEMQSAISFSTEGGMPSEPAPLGDLRSPSRLRELTTTGPALIGYNFGKFHGIESPVDPPLVETLPLSLETLRIVECHPTSEFMAALGEEPDDSLGMDPFRSCLHSEILLLCRDTRFAKMRSIELEHFGAMQGVMGSPEWTSKYAGDTVVLTRE